MRATPSVIENVVNKDLCTGCGLCTNFCKSSALKMDWNEFGFIVPKLVGTCDQDNSCIAVCPFNPFPDKEVRTETEISEDLFPNSTTIKFHEKLGKYRNTYIGFSDEFRESSSSGGLATYVSLQLLKNKIVDHILNVQEQSGKFEYIIQSRKEELVSSSKTRYYPVTMEKVFAEINTLDGNVAIVGVPCFIKGVRLAQHKNLELKKKIAFTIGIVCGGIKSKFFTEYLVQKVGVKDSHIKGVDYRIKDFESSAGDYSFGAKTDNSDGFQTIKMKAVGDMWGTGLFKSNACDFCDDVSAELADISLGDAWIRPYVNDGRGTNVIITRSLIADKIIQDGIDSRELIIDLVNENEFIKSQKGSYTHRQKCLPYRIKKSDIEHIPPKRFSYGALSPELRIIQKMRRKTRKMSLDIWRDYKNAAKFDAEMKSTLKRLRIITKLNHYKRGILERVKQLF